MNEIVKQKRDALKSLSSIAAERVKAGEFATINEALVAMYKEAGHTEIHSFKHWLTLGFVVRKGEKALLLWGEPVKSQKQEKEVGSDDDDFKFFPLAFVFSQQQVDKLIVHAKA